MRIVHIITRLIIGGAQENTVLCCEDLLRQYGDTVLLVTGPPLGPEGSLLERARAGGVPLEIIPQLRRPIQPWNDLLSYGRIKSLLRRFRPDVVHTHSTKAASWAGPPPGRSACRPSSTRFTAHRSIRGRAGGRGGCFGPANAGPPTAAMRW